MRTVVVGGVATGMSAAARLRRLDEDAEIIVLEKGPYVSYANCGLPYYVGGEIAEESSLLVQTPTQLRSALNLDVRVNHEVVAVDPAAKLVTARHGDKEVQIQYDNLVLAPGATAVRPPLPGFDNAAVWHLRTVPDATAIRRRLEAGSVRNAVVLGGGFIGLEAAEALARQGVDVTVVELSSHVLPPAEPEVAARINQELQQMGIDAITGVAAQSVDATADHVEVVLADGERIPADLVLLSVGVRPATMPFVAAGLEALPSGALLVDEHGRTSAPSIWAGGDAVASPNIFGAPPHPVPLAGPANRAGRLIADDIARASGIRVTPRTQKPPLGTAVIRVGGVTVAMTGANRVTLREAAVAHHTINLHPLDHAGYFPGASQVHLVVHFAREDGTLLGAQAIGTAGVDKRIDVLATAIAAGMKVSDLIDLDLAYSPPYGSAKDPINMVGYVGQNVMEGLTHLWHPEDIAELADTSLLLDVRSREEYASGHFTGALNIPHTELRERLNEVRQAAKGRPVRVNCQSGLRSYLAERILVQEGFEDVANLSGGMITAIDAIAGGAAPAKYLSK